MPATTIRADARCARGDHCGNAARAADGTLIPDWADHPSPFCHRCTTAVARTLTAMPARYAWLRHHIGEKGTRPDSGPVTGGAVEAPLPLRADIDALIRDMVDTLCSWEERVADAAGLHRPVTADSRRRRDEVALPAAAAMLAARLDVLLLLPAEPMTRTMELTRSARPLPKGTLGWVHKTAGFIRYYADLSGADAGREIFRLAWMSRRLLGETLPPPDRLDGIPCKGCDVLGLEVCADPDYRSECAACGDLLTAGEYLDWVRLYSARARRWVEEGVVVPADPRGYSQLAA